MLEEEFVADALISCKFIFVENLMLCFFAAKDIKKLQAKKIPHKW